jgi:hypothetical protein
MVADKAEGTLHPAWATLGCPDSKGSVSRSVLTSGLTALPMHILQPHPVFIQLMFYICHNY